MNVVKVRLRKPRRVFSFLCSDLPLNRDDECIVLSDRGEEWGTCILPPEPCPSEMTKRYNMKVLRKTTETDEKNYAYIEDEERSAREICLKKIRSRHLPMKLVDVEVTLDKKKVIFYFTADDRVDFRELVRDLAHDLRARIEMRHIQVRDEARMVGGIGGCGRELCCSSWMNEFQPISMRMAKAQNLSLNPSKISGQCGRLLCCLSHENEQYEAMRKKARQEAKTKQAEERKPVDDEIDDTNGVDSDATEAPRRESPRERPRREARDADRRPEGRGRGRKPDLEQPAAEAPAEAVVAEADAGEADSGDDKKSARRKRSRNRRRKKRDGAGSGGGGES
jgi:cell fate regulator YaaT (PSP1 superfamily)